MDGLGCATAKDCVSVVCVVSTCQIPSCTDGVKNGTETGTDCGGTCPPCVANQENDCLTCDTSIGLGLTDTGASGYDRGAGYECLSTLCSQGDVNTSGNGQLWAK